MWLLVSEMNKGRRTLSIGFNLSRISYWASSHCSIELMPPYGCVVLLDFCSLEESRFHSSQCGQPQEAELCAHTELAVSAAAEAVQVATGKKIGEAERI